MSGLEQRRPAGRLDVSAAARSQPLEHGGNALATADDIVTSA
jgi:hypothetical protein